MGGWGCHPQGPTQAGLPLRPLEHGWGARAPSGHLRHLLYLWLNPSQRFVCLVRTSKGETGDKGPGLPLHTSDHWGVPVLSNSPPLIRLSA